MDNRALGEESRSRPAYPGGYPVRVLLCVSGLSPQVVTETIYALAVARPPEQRFVPTQVLVITTARGAELASEALLAPVTGAFHAMSREYSLEGVRFGREDILTIRGEGAEDLPDIQSPEDTVRAGDEIMALVRRIVSDPECALHVSLAGGRKTMGFYAGYALSLLGRAQDRLSHVLVNEPFDSVPEFFYPPPTPALLRDRRGHGANTRDAKVTLAEIPFVRLQLGVPARLLSGPASFSETVAIMERALQAPLVALRVDRRIVNCGGVPVTLPAQLFAIYLWLARRRVRGEDGDGFAGIAKTRLPGEDLLGVIAEVHGDGLDKRELDMIRAGMSAEWFREKRAKVNGALKAALGPASAPFLVASSGKRGNMRYGISLPPDRIDLQHQGDGK